ncbi:MAG TPA: RNA methyltransferase [Nitrospiria bacterium]|jgi:TrmH family RNA methyltransferase|nr:RNA methyltransferase [Nitrospiria bacterium]
MADPLKNISIVLVRPTRPGNIGAAARAIKNMGLSRLVLVRPVDPLSSDSYTMAYGAHDVLQRAKVYGSLRTAVARCRYVVGTTARTHKGYGKPSTLMKTVPDLLARAKRHPVAVLFGPESSGLANDEIALCQSLVTIPTAEAHTSINLAQAVMVVAYELRRCAETGNGKNSAKGRAAVDTDQRERFYAEMKTLLEMIGFVKGTQGTHIQADLRRIFGRAEPDERELRILRGIVRQVRWALTHR